MIEIVSAALAAIAVALWIGWRHTRLQFFQKLGIPGPKPGFIFGNLWEMYRKNPPRCKREWLQKYGKVIGYYHGLEPILLIAEVELIKQVLVKNFNSFTDRPLHLFDLSAKTEHRARHLIHDTGHRWKEVRSLLTPSFTTGKLKKMAPLMTSALEVLDKKIEVKAKSGEEFEIYNLYKGLTMDVIGRTAFGIEANVQDNPTHPLMRTAKAIFSGEFKNILLIIGVSFREFTHFFIALFNLRLRFRNKGLNPMSELLSTCDDVVRMRKEDPSLRRPDLLQTLIDTTSSGDIKKIKLDKLVASAEGEDGSDDAAEASSDGGHKIGSSKGVIHLSDKDITGNALLFFLAGYETTSTGLAIITHYLVNKQDIQEILRQEIMDKIGKDESVNYDSVQKLPYMDRFIMECFRMIPPIYAFVNRMATREVQVGEWKLPKDTVVQIPVQFLHHDPDLWPNPEQFDPDRFLPENRSPDHSIIWQPFGAGPRNCIGMRFALLEIKLALTRILRKYRLVPSAHTEKEHDLELKIAPAILSPKKGIFVKAVPLN